MIIIYNPKKNGLEHFNRKAKKAHELTIFIIQNIGTTWRVRYVDRTWSLGESYLAGAVCRMRVCPFNDKSIWKFNFTKLEHISGDFQISVFTIQKQQPPALRSRANRFGRKRCFFLLLLTTKQIPFGLPCWLCLHRSRHIL